MNSVYKRFLLKNIIIGLLVFIIPFLLVFLNLFGSDNNNFFNYFRGDSTIIERDNYFDIEAYTLYCNFLIVLFTIYSYNYLFEKRVNTLKSQYPLSKKQLFLTPIACILVPAVLSDSIFLNTIDYLNFNQMFSKYFLISLILLFSCISNNRQSFIVICVISVLTYTLGSNQLINNILFLPAASIFSISLTLIINSLIIVISYYIYKYKLKYHNYSKLMVIYYLIILFIGSIFFVGILINKYPYHTNLQGLDIFGYSFSIPLYLAIIILVICYVYFKWQQFSVKKILLILSPVLIISLIYVGIDSITSSIKPACDLSSNLDSDHKVSSNLQFRKKDGSIYIESNTTNQSVIKFLNKNALSCSQAIDSYSSNVNYDFDEIKKRNQAVISYDSIDYIIKVNNTTYTDLIDLQATNNTVGYAAIVKDNIEYRAFYLPSSLSQQRVTELKSVLNKTKTIKPKYITIYFDDQDGIELFNKIISKSKITTSENLSNGLLAIVDQKFLVDTSERDFTDGGITLDIPDDQTKQLEKYINERVK